MLRRSAVGALLGACCLLVSTCAEKQLDTANMSFRNPDGSVNRGKLASVFGAANSNLKLAPNAINVGYTESASSVSIQPDSLTFADASAGWLQQVRAGYVLYCGEVCGGTGFLRRVLSVQRSAAGLTLATEVGDFTDIVKAGWMHVEIPLVPEAQPQDNRRKKHGGSSSPCNFSNGASCTFNVTNVSLSSPVQLPAPIQGSLTGTVTFQSNLIIDLVVGQNASGSSQTNLISVEITGNPTAGITLDASVADTVDKSWSFNQSWNLFGPVVFPIGEFLLGPVPVNCQVAVTGTAQASIGGSMSLNGNALATVSAGLGFQWNRNPPKGQDQVTALTNWNPNFTETLTGNASAQASASFNATTSIQLLAVGFTGPQVSAVGAVGVQGSAKVTLGENGTLNDTGADLQTDCSAGATGDFYFNASATAGVTLDLFGIKNFSKNYTLYTKNWTFPDPPLSLALPADVAAACNTNNGVNFEDAGSAASCLSAGTACSSGGSCCANLTCDPGSGTCIAAASTGPACLQIGASCSGGGTCCSGEVCDPASGNCLATAGGATTTSSAGTDAGSCQCSSGSGPCPDGTTLSSCCSGGQQDCGDGQGCHDVSVDPANCGGCGNSCTTSTGSSTSTCAGGQCSCMCPNGGACPDGATSASCTTTASTTSCAAGTADCAGTGQCQTTTSTDGNNCGACGVICATGVCSNSQCLCSDGVTPCADNSCASCPACPAGFANCGDGQCDVATATDPNNCGACGTVCSTNLCSNSQCLCSDDMTPCSDPSCASCPANPCGAGTANCGDGTCDVNTATDPNNCGGCGNVCPSGTCTAGACTCSGGGAACPDGSCPNPDNQSDPSHCGASCVNCPNQTGSAASTCNAGSCACLCSDGVTPCPDGATAASCAATSCPSGQQDCQNDGTCDDLTGSDPTNCGSCGNNCTAAGTGNANYGPNSSCQPGSPATCVCSCTCSGGTMDGSACPNCDQTQCS